MAIFRNTLDIGNRLSKEVVTRIRKVLDLIKKLHIPVSEDLNYRKHFNTSIGPQIYNMHLKKSYTCCAFCVHLKRSTCGGHCFICSKGTYEGCSPILPGIYPFTGECTSAYETGVIPWIYKKPCRFFCRLEPDRYFRNFIERDPDITLANFEALEGIYSGISRGKRPCHICVSVDIGIYNACVKSKMAEEKTPCQNVKREIPLRYGAARLL